MRNTKITAEEIEATEVAAEARKQNRNQGFSMMSVRDQGYTKIRDLNGRGVALLWPTAREALEGEAFRRIPEGAFVMEFRGESGKMENLVFDAEELKKWLRWA